MSYSQAFVLSLVQGLTEFLPISSSGHLVLLQKFFSIDKPPVFFDIMVHVGTLGAVLFYFKNQLIKILNELVRGERKSIALLAKIVIGSIPAGIVGLFLNQQIETLFSSSDLVGGALLVTAILLFSTKLIKKLTKSIEELSPNDAFIVGLFQALAILPGVSRSGSTIVGSLWRGIDRRTAFQFSFYLAIPAILGALFFQIPDFFNGSITNLGQGLLGMIIAGLVGYGALRLLEIFLLKASLWIFGFYCVILGIVSLFLV